MPYVNKELETRPHEEHAYEVIGDAGVKYSVHQDSRTGHWYCHCDAFRFTKRDENYDRKPCKHIRTAQEYHDKNNPDLYEVVVTRHGSLVGRTKVALNTSDLTSLIDYLYDHKVEK